MSVLVSPNMELEIVLEENTNFEEDQAVQTILNDQIITKNSLVTEKILSHLRNKDLISCALVSKHWNAVFRAYHWHHRQCLLTLNLDDPEELQSVLESNILNNNHPFNGASFIISWDACKIFTSKLKKLQEERAQILSLIENILENLTVKHVRIPFATANSSHKFVVTQFLLPLLTANEMETLSTPGAEKIRWTKLFKSFPKSQSFPNLKIIKADGVRFYEYFSWFMEKDFEAILSKCPNLKELGIPIPSDLVEMFEERNKMFLIKHLRLKSCWEWNLDNENFKIIEKFCRNSLEILDIDKFNMWMDNAFPCILRILELNSGSLRQFKLFPFPFYSCMDKFEFPPLPGVQIVEITYEWRPVWADGGFLVRDPIWQELFPNAEITLQKSSAKQSYSKYYIKYIRLYYEVHNCYPAHMLVPIPV